MSSPSPCPGPHPSAQAAACCRLHHDSALRVGTIIMLVAIAFTAPLVIIVLLVFCCSGPDKQKRGAGAYARSGGGSSNIGSPSYDPYRPGGNTDPYRPAAGSPRVRPSNKKGWLGWMLGAGSGRKGKEAALPLYQAGGSGGGGKRMAV